MILLMHPQYQELLITDCRLLIAMDLASYSDVIQISNRQIEGIKMYPTVVNNTNMFVETDKPIRNAKLEFFDMSGKKIGETTWETLNGRQSLQPIK